MQKAVHDAVTRETITKDQNGKQELRNYEYLNLNPLRILAFRIVKLFQKGKNLRLFEEK